ncbi:protein rep [Microbacterium sp. P02]|uniref:protein rep n=1 Tax=Microbacterium sp. P02 TaxID=3366260 RepID=UPI00366EE2C0
MNSVLARPITRVPFVRRPQEPAHLLDYSIDPENLSSKRAARAFILEYSSLQKLKRCSSIYLKTQGSWNRCEHPLCSHCARRRAYRLSAELEDLARAFPVALSLTLTLQSTAGTALEAAWDALDAVRTAFAGGRWLTTQVDAYRWHVELTRNADAWHPHLHLLLVSENEQDPAAVDSLRVALIERWQAVADRAGHYADPAGQHLDLIGRTRGRAIRYLAKGPMSQQKEEMTAGRIFSDAAHKGDADAAALWEEIERASEGRRWQGTGGVFRNSSR